MSSTLNDLENHMAFNKAYYNNTKKDDTKTNDTKKSDCDEFTILLNKYYSTKLKYDQSYKTLTLDQIKKYKDDFKQQEKIIIKKYNLLNKKHSKYHVGDFIICFNTFIKSHMIF